MKRVTIEFEDSKQANSFRDEMKKRFHYPKTTRHEVAYGRDENGNAVYVSSSNNPGKLGRILMVSYYRKEN